MLNHNRITITHFCSKTGKLFEDYDPQTGKSIPLTTEIKNSVLGAWFPHQTYYYGEVYKTSQKEEMLSVANLEKLNNVTLQFSDQEKFLFDGEIRQRVFQCQMSDGAVRFGMMKTECKEMRDVSTKLLIVDEQNWANNEHLKGQLGEKTLEAIREQLGDGFSVVSPELHARMLGNQPERVNTPFQFRMGADPNLDTNVQIEGYWESKGMIATWNQFPQALRDKGIEGIISQSCVKIGKVREGVYHLDLDVGIKDYAGRTRQKLGPQAGNILMVTQSVTEEFLKLVDQQLAELSEKLENPYDLMQDFLQYNQDKYQERAKDEYLKRKNLDISELSQEDLEEIESLADELKTMVAYQVLKAPYGKQLIDHPYVVSALEKHVQQRYQDLVTLSFEKWNRATLLPGNLLGEAEFSDLSLPEGKELVISRSPNASANSFVTLKNVHHPMYQAENRKGVVYMNPETAKRIQADFDGDNVYFEEVDKKLYLQKFREWQTQQSQLLGQSGKILQTYRELSKNAKVPYDQETFEEIALAAKDDMVGLIANNLMHWVAIENEVPLYPEAKKEDYLAIARDTLVQQFFTEDGKITQGLSEEGKQKLSLIEETESIDLISQDLVTITDENRDIEERLRAIASLAHHIVEVMSKQLQIAVDSMKSAERPSEGVLKLSKEMSEMREIGWVGQYKDKELYKGGKILSSSSHSALAQIAQRVNGVYLERQIEMRPTHQFQSAFADIESSKKNDEGIKPEDSHEYKAEKVIREYHRRLAYAQRLKAELDEAPGPRLRVEGEWKLVNSKGVEITLDEVAQGAYGLKFEQNYEINFSPSESKIEVSALTKGKKVRLGEINRDNPMYQPLMTQMAQSPKGFNREGIKLRGRPPLEIINILSYEEKNSILQDLRALDGQKVPLSFVLDEKTGKVNVVAPDPQKSREEGKEVRKVIGQVSGVGEGQKYLRSQLNNAKNGWYYLSKKGEAGVTVTTRPGTTEGVVNAAFVKASQYKQSVRERLEQIPSEERMKLAGAAWEITHRKKNNQEYWYSKANAVFNLFYEEVAQQFEQPRFTELAVGGVNTPYNELETIPDGIVPIYIGIEDNLAHPAFNRATLLVNGQTLGYLTEDSPQLPIDTLAQATIVKPPLGAKALVTLADGETFYVNALKNFDYAQEPLEQVQGEIIFTTAIAQKKPKNPSPAVMLNGQLLGIVSNTKDHRSRDYLVEKGYFSKKGKQWQVNPNQPIPVTVQRDQGFPVVTVQVKPETIQFPERFIMNKGIIEKENRPAPRKELWANAAPETPPPEPSPYEVQAQRTKQIAPLLKAFMEVQNRSKLTGNVMKVNYDAQAKCLSLSEQQTGDCVLMASFRLNEKGQEICHPLAVPLPDKKPLISERLVEEIREKFGRTPEQVQEKFAPNREKESLER